MPTYATIASGIAGKSVKFTTVRFPLETLLDAPLPTLNCRLQRGGGEGDPTGARHFAPVEALAAGPPLPHVVRAPQRRPEASRLRRGHFIGRILPAPRGTNMVRGCIR
jgi:hypothetical protein